MIILLKLKRDKKKVLLSSLDIYRPAAIEQLNQIAKSFNGGGHAFASGAVLHQPINEAKKVIVDKTRDMIQEQLDSF